MLAEAELILQTERRLSTGQASSPPLTPSTPPSETVLSSSPPTSVSSSTFALDSTSSSSLTQVPRNTGKGVMSASSGKAPASKLVAGATASSSTSSSGNSSGVASLTGSSTSSRTSFMDDDNKELYDNSPAPLGANGGSSSGGSGSGSSSSTSSSNSRGKMAPPQYTSQHSHYASGSSSSAAGGSSSSSSRPTFVGSSSSAFLTTTAGGSGSSSSNAGGSSSRPAHLRMPTSASSHVASPAPLSSKGNSFPFSTEPRSNNYSNEQLDFDKLDYGDLPFFDMDPHTGVIYGDPYVTIRPYLTPDQPCYDVYQLEHDAVQPKRLNVFNKHGVLVYYSPGKHIGADQDSLRSPVSAVPLWAVNGRSSSWTSLLAQEGGTSKRQIKLNMEIPKPTKSTVAAQGGYIEPAARFVFRWKESDMFFEFRKTKDQYTITSYEMFGPDSKYKAPTSKPSQTVFHGLGMDTAGMPHQAVTVGTPSPYEAHRPTQMISEYSLNSGLVRKQGIIKLFNPDTCPTSFRTFLIALSISILDAMRPFDEKAFRQEFPNVLHAGSSGSGWKMGARKEEAKKVAAAAAAAVASVPAVVVEPKKVEVVNKTATTVMEQVKMDEKKGGAKKKRFGFF